MSILSASILIALLLLFVLLGILSFFGRFQWIWFFGFAFLIIFYTAINFVFTFGFSSFLLKNIRLKAIFENISSDSITIITSLLSSSLSIVVANLINKQRDIEESKRKTKREDYKYYEQTLDGLISYLIESKVKLDIYDCTEENIESKDIENLIKGILRYQIYSEIDFVKPLLNSSCIDKRKTTINKLRKKIDFFYKRCLIISNKAKEQANNDDYLEAIKTITIFIGKTSFENE